MAEEKRKTTIHARGGEYDDNLSIYEIERSLHPRSPELVRKELTWLIDKFLEKYFDETTGTIKNANKAADVFIEMLAKYHFGEERFESLKGNKKHLIDTVREKYGVSQHALREAFEKEGAYESREDFYRSHRDPMVTRVDETKKRQAQESLNVYLNDENARGELYEHIEARSHPLNKKYLTLEDAVTSISAYMRSPDALEKIEKDQKGSVDMPKTLAGQPGIYHLFKKGKEYHETYKKERRIADTSHRLEA